MESYERQSIQYKKWFEKAVCRAQIALKNGKLNSTMGWAQIAADIAWQKHLGFYTSVTLESLLLEVANKLNQENKAQAVDQKIHFERSKGNKTHVLHVMTEAYGVGGHTRVVTAWILNTIDTAISSVVTTDQQCPLPKDLVSAIAASGGKYQSLGEYSSKLLTRSLLLRQLSQKWADVVVLHVHPSDATPIVAFGVAKGPPVIVFNHADFTFWLGASVADLVADLRPAGQKLSLRRRGIRDSIILPIPMSRAKIELDKKVARKQLGIRDDETVLLTVGNEYKYTPFGGYDFVGTMVKLLRRNPKVVLYAIGPRQIGRWATASSLVGGRIRALGFINWLDVHKFYASADIFVDGFPMGGMTAMLEVGVLGVPTVGLHIPEAPCLNAFDDVAIERFGTYAPSLETFNTSLESMIAQPSLHSQKTTQIKQSIERNHFPPGWNNFLDDALRSLRSEHSIKLADSLGSPDNNDNFFTGFETAVLENPDYQRNLRGMLINHAIYLSRNEQIMAIPEIMLKTNTALGLGDPIYLLRQTLHLGL